ncbi:hypothetical protein OSB04_014976 [Centaurea solstitialis]|uniref:PGG domain-containing protein n=1 Tax=Centaurea solstitialis TaxID=347529 RepID=A0AA38T9B1_9ASTR|nr:hypothetical protein OSB04_014976 [Centaurea solstitialis]
MADSSSAPNVSTETEHSNDQDTSDGHKNTYTQDSKDQKASNGDRNKSLEMAESSARIEDLKYLRNYHVWKVQMVCLMESQKMGGIVDDKFEGPGATQAGTIKQYDNLLKGWIFRSLSEDVLIIVADLESARAVWEKLKVIYVPKKHTEEGEATTTPFSNVALPVHVDMDINDKKMQESKYQAASNVNVSNFVSEKLSRNSNYDVWKAQMLCLMKSQEMAGIVDDEFNNMVATKSKFEKQYDNLVKGWIFGSLSQELLIIVVALDSAREVWRRLKLIFDHEKSLPQDLWKPPILPAEPQDSASKKPATQPEPQDSASKKPASQPTEPQDSASKLPASQPTESQDSTLKKFVIQPEKRQDSASDNPFTMVQMKPVTGTEKKDNTIRNKKLLKATVEGRWWEAKSILENDKQAATEAIADDGSTMLHFAVGTGQNDFVKELLNFIEHELLVEKRRDLLGISDHKACVPLHSAYYNVKLDTFVYLLGAAEIRPQPRPSGFYPSFGFQSGASTFTALIYTKQYDLAITWVISNPEVVTKDDKVLMAIATNFPSDLGLGELLIYPGVNTVCRKLVKRCSLLFYPYNYLYTKAKDILWAMKESSSNNYNCSGSHVLCSISVDLCLQFGDFLPPLCAIFPPVEGGPITRIDKKRKDYIKAKKILNLVCDKIDEMSFSSPINPYYKKAILEAASQGAHEVVNEILLRSPKTIGSLSKTGHNIIQLAVINRSEKVYNCICHFVERMDLSVKDSSNNNLLHLAGRLAPSFVLSRTTGAALQLQQELQWSKEVKKFMSPTELVEENIHMETPETVFSKEHKDLVKEGEKWMKTTAESCSITAALITTIVFAAAITVPGGSNQETGIPLFRKEIPFIVFAISDAISLFASSTALLVFLSILTARFSEQDFLVSLPRRLIIGLCTLFLSTIAMMVAFSAVLFLMFCDQRGWMAAIIGGLASLPIAAIITLQFPLVVDLFLSTYYRPIFLADCGKSNMNNMRSSLITNQTHESSFELKLQCIMGFKQHASISIKHTHVHRRSSFLGRSVIYLLVQISSNSIFLI